MNPQDWLATFAAALTRADIPAVVALFHQDCYWRDLLAFTWNIKTMEGRPAIAAMLHATLPTTAPTDWAVTSPPETEGDATTVWISFQTATAHGTGRLTLRNDLCHTLLTATEDLKGHEEPRGQTRPQGIVHKADRERQTWRETRDAETARIGQQDQPYVLVIGGGQGGIALGARLRQLGVPTLIVERNARAGDSWRNRYRSLVLHDPVWYDHLPYIPFPAHWPVFTPKDQMGDWLQAYALALDLDIWTSSSVEKAAWQGDRWAVTVRTPQGSVTVNPVELVFATGAYGPPRAIDWPGAAGFAGTLLHSSAYQDGRAYLGKRAVVVGAASSAHDVAVDLWEGGAEVTLIQRSSTCVVRSETLMDLAFDIYSEQATADGIDVDRADLIAAATPFALQPEAQRTLYKRIRARDADFYQRLQATGFLLDFGDDDTGLMMKAYRTGSGYYVDVGASELIINGDIKVKAGVAIDTLTPTGIRFADGTEIAADAIIQSTGFQSMHEVVAQLVDRQTADAVGPCWGLGSGHRNDPLPWHGELRNMYKPTAQENLWFQGGNLALSRFFSKFLALQLKARYEGLPTPIYRTPLL